MKTKMTSEEIKKHVKPSIDSVYSMLSEEGKKKFLDRMENNLDRDMFIDDELDSSGALYVINMTGEPEEKLKNRLAINPNYKKTKNMHFVVTHEMTHLMSYPETLGDVFKYPKPDGKNDRGGVARRTADHKKYGIAIQEAMANIGTKIAIARENGHTADEVLTTNFSLDGEGENSYIEFEKLAKMLAMLYSEPDDYESVDKKISRCGIDKVENPILNSCVNCNGYLVEKGFNSYFDDKDMWEGINTRLDEELTHLQDHEGELSETKQETFKLYADVVKYAHDKKIGHAFYLGKIDMERKQELEDLFDDLYMNAIGRRNLRKVVINEKKQEI